VDRIKYLLEHYQQAPATEQGLVIMANSYDKLGLNDLRDDTLKVLKTNFPKSTLTNGESIKKSKAWWRFW
jgi:outer membrane protein assembly factor BamD